MNTKSVKAAKETTIFVINYNGDVEETNLYDHVMESADKTTSPRGVMTRIFVEEAQLDQEGNEVVSDFTNAWVVKTWGVGGRGPSKIIANFETEEEARDDWFTRIYNFDFQQDDQRDTNYYSTRKEAEKHIAELYPNPDEE